MVLKKIELYPAAALVDLGNLSDNDPPISEAIEAVFIDNAMVGCYGYVTKGFKNIEHIVSPRHRNTIGYKSILSNYITKKKIKVDVPIISIAHGWYDNYYHFTLECLVKVFLLREYIPNAMIVFPKKISQFHKEWFDLLDIKNIIFINENEVVSSPQVISCNFPNRDLNHHHLITADFRNWILEKVKSKGLLKDLGYSKKIFINRSKAKHRRLLNSEEAIPIMENKGYDIIDLEGFSIVDQINLFYHSDCISGIHGASFTNCVFMRKNTQVFDFMHEKFNQLCFLKLAKVLDLNYSGIKCEGNNSHELPGYCDISITAEQLKTLV